MRGMMMGDTEFEIGPVVRICVTEWYVTLLLLTATAECYLSLLVLLPSANRLFAFVHSILPHLYDHLVMTTIMYVV
jgi:hypothetical protein